MKKKGEETLATRETQGEVCAFHLIMDEQRKNQPCGSAVSPLEGNIIPMVYLVATFSPTPTRQGHVQVFGARGTDSTPQQRPATGSEAGQPHARARRLRPRAPPARRTWGRLSIANPAGYTEGHYFFPFRPANPWYLLFRFPCARDRGSSPGPWPTVIHVELRMKQTHQSYVIMPRLMATLSVLVHPRGSGAAHNWPL